MASEHRGLPHVWGSYQHHSSQFRKVVRMSEVQPENVLYAWSDHYGTDSGTHDKYGRK